MAEKTNTHLKVDVYDLTGKVVDSMALPSQIFDVKVNPSLITQAVRVYQANLRMGTHGSKTRGMVSGTTKKMFKQKGTGRARHGSAKAPIFVGGGTAHGPHPRDYSLDLPKSMRRLALLGVLSQRVKESQIKIVDGIKSLEGKTKPFFQSLVSLNVFPKYGKRKKALFLLSENLPTVYQAGKNIENLTIKDAHLINALDILLYRNIVLMKEGVQTLADTFGKKDETKRTQSSNVKAQIKSQIPLRKTSEQANPKPQIKKEVKEKPEKEEAKKVVKKPVKRKTVAKK